MSGISAVLDRAAERLAQPGAWTQRSAARDFAGRECDAAQGGVAVSWCICGAVDTAVQGTVITYEEALTPLGGDKAAIAFNDAEGRTQEQVVGWVRRAAARAHASETRKAAHA